MSPVEKVRLLLTEAGPILEIDEVIEFSDPLFWTLVWDEDHVIEVDVDERLGKLYFAATIGHVSESSAPKVHPMLLKYNYSWENTGGARIALAGEDGEVVLVHDVPVADLDLQELRVVLVHLTSSMAAWRETLVAFEAPAARHDQPFDGIRV